MSESNVARQIREAIERFADQSEPSLKESSMSETNESIALAEIREAIDGLTRAIETMNRDLPLLSARDLFAAFALAGLLARGEHADEAVAGAAYEQADAMLAQGAPVEGGPDGP